MPKKTDYSTEQYDRHKARTRDRQRQITNAGKVAFSERLATIGGFIACSCCGGEFVPSACVMAAKDRGKNVYCSKKCRLGMNLRKFLSNQRLKPIGEIPPTDLQSIRAANLLAVKQCRECPGLKDEIERLKRMLGTAFSERDAAIADSEECRLRFDNIFDDASVNGSSDIKIRGGVSERHGKKKFRGKFPLGRKGSYVFKDFYSERDAMNWVSSGNVLLQQAYDSISLLGSVQ